MKTKTSFFTPAQKEEIAASYELLRPKYESLCNKVHSLLIEFLKRNSKLKCASVTHRAKDKESFLEKLDRKAYSSPFDEINDFAGVRVVLYQSSDMAAIENFLKEEFVVIEKENKNHELGIEKMGYGGIHFVIRLGEKYSGFGDREINSLRCEVQVRTVLQDAWSSISHSLVYKSPLSLPEKLQREFNSMSILLEIADAGFERIIESKQELASRARDEIRESKFMAMPITIERIEEYSRSRFSHLPVSNYWQECLAIDLHKIDSFKSMQDIETAIRRSKNAVSAYEKERPDLFRTSTDYLTKSIGFVSPEFQEIHPFSSSTLDAFKKYAKLVEKP